MAESTAPVHSSGARHSLLSKSKHPILLLLPETLQRFAYPKRHYCMHCLECKAFARQMNRVKLSRKAESSTHLDHFQEHSRNTTANTKRAEEQQGPTARGHRTASTLAQQTDRASTARGLAATTATIKRVRFGKGPLPHTPDG